MAFWKGIERDVLKTTATRVTSQRAAQAAALTKAKYAPVAGQNGSAVTAEDGYGDGTWNVLIQPVTWVLEK